MQNSHKIVLWVTGLHYYLRKLNRPDPPPISLRAYVLWVPPPPFPRTSQGAGTSHFFCASCGREKQVMEIGGNQYNGQGMLQYFCIDCCRAMGSATAAAAAAAGSGAGGYQMAPIPTRIAPAAGEGFVRCVACCQLKPTSCFGVNQLRRRAGIERCAACVEAEKGSMVLCNACHRQRPFTDFSKKQLACKPGSERCRQCIEASMDS